MAKRSRKTSRRFRRRLLPGIFLLLLALLAIAAVYVAWLDREVRTAFEGKLWALPASVFAQSRDIYPGLNLSVSALRDELLLLGYRPASDSLQPGEFRQQDATLAFHSRDFRFWDGKEPARRIRVRFSGSAIESIVDLDQDRAIPIMRMEPQLIGKIYPEHHEDRILVRLDEVPQGLIDALIAVEDRNFHHHRGVDPGAILRAAWVNLRARAIRQGGSTLTQQLVKNFYLEQERTWWRKFNEALMALLLEAHFDKDAILEAYLNEVYLGQQGRSAIHGFGLGAEFYFQRPLQELTLEQQALLVGLIRGASHYNPRRHPQRALQRRNLVLQLLADQGHVEPQTAQAMQQSELGISPVPGWTGDRYPAFIDLVRRQLQRDYATAELRNEGLRIFTTLNPRHQQQAQQALDRRLQLLVEQGRDAQLQGAVVVASVYSGEVTAVVGMRSLADVGFNRALDARRQIGSLVKPVVYLAALDQPRRYNVISLLQDAPVKLPQPDGSDWMPENFDRMIHGAVPMHLALARSYNLATVNLGLELGVDTVAAQMRKLLPGTRVPAYPSLLLGAIDLSPFEVTQIYQSLAAGGFRAPLKAIAAVLDHEGRPLSRYPLSTEQVAAVEASYLVRYLLAEVVRSGTARSASARLPGLLPLAGKTGSSNDLRDSWFAGFGSDLVATVWIGLDDNRPTELTGASGALPVWIDLMESLQPGPVSLAPPAGVRLQNILAGQRTDADCPQATAFPFTLPYLPEGYLPCQRSPQPDTVTEPAPRRWNPLSR